MSNGKIKCEQSENDTYQSSEVISIGYFKWFVLVTYVIFSASLAMCELIFAPIPKQTAAYYGILGTYFEFLIEKTFFTKILHQLIKKYEKSKPGRLVLHCADVSSPSGWSFYSLLCRFHWFEKIFLD